MKKIRWGHIWLFLYLIYIFYKKNLGLWLNSAGACFFRNFPVAFTETTVDVTCGKYVSMSRNKTSMS